MKTFSNGVPEPIAALNKIKIQENNEPLVDLRKFCPLVTIREENDVQPYLRETVATMLDRASRLIPSEYHLQVRHALRSYTKQKELWDTQYLRNKKEHPSWPEAALCRAVNRYVAPCNQPAPPGHCTGGAVDVVLQTKKGDFVDVIPPLEDWSIGHTWTTNIDPQVREKRMILVQAMLQVGFSNCRDEYWHYSWGDSAWAVRTGKSTCPYGKIAVGRNI